MASNLKKVLVDADVLVALAKSDDSNHQKAIRISRALTRASLYVSPFTIPEAATVLSHKVSHTAAKSFLRAVRKRKLRQLALSLRIEKQADRIFLKQKRRGVSWPDCLNVAMIKAHKIEAIFSFDKFYKKLGIGGIPCN